MCVVQFLCYVAFYLSQTKKPLQFFIIYIRLLTEIPLRHNIYIFCGKELRHNCFFRNMYYLAFEHTRLFCFCITCVIIIKVISLYRIRLYTMYPTSFTWPSETDSTLFFRNFVQTNNSEIWYLMLMW